MRKRVGLPGIASANRLCEAPDGVLTVIHTANPVFNQPFQGGYHGSYQ